MGWKKLGAKLLGKTAGLAGEFGAGQLGDLAGEEFEAFGGEALGGLANMATEQGAQMGFDHGKDFLMGKLLKQPQMPKHPLPGPYGHEAQPPMQGYGHETRPPMRRYGRETPPAMQGYGHESPPPMRRYGRESPPPMQRYGRETPPPIRGYGPEVQPSMRGYGPETFTPPMQRHRPMDRYNLQMHQGNMPLYPNTAYPSYIARPTFSPQMPRRPRYQDNGYPNQVMRGPVPKSFQWSTADTRYQQDYSFDPTKAYYKGYVRQNMSPMWRSGYYY